MTDRDRLIELISDLPFSAEYEKYNSLEFAEYLADHLIANGVIVPPCKVGDKVYYINTFYQKNPIIIKCEVDALHITSGKNRIGHKKPSYALIINENMKSLSTRVYFENFGKTVFFTKEEAEKVLMESENNA